MQNLIRITIPGAASAPRDSRADLVDDFLLSTGDLAPEDAARIAGVSVATLNRWRRSGTRRLRKDIRDRLLDYLREPDRRAA